MLFVAENKFHFYEVVYQAALRADPITRRANNMSGTVVDRWERSTE